MSDESPNSSLASRRLGSRIAATVRWLHIYLSMFGFATILLFSVTGITLNHPTWFGLDADRIDDVSGEIEREWLQSSADAAVDQLAIAEFLRSRHRLHGAVREFRVDEFECFVSFKGPGYAADAFIDRATGRYQLTVSQHGAVAVLNDLHKGRDTGRSWSLVIDLSAGLMGLSAVTGLVLLFYLKRRRVAGLVTALVGTVAIVAAYLWLVP
ncbi:MAG TPA: PepSY-associated TM helix domain-containing protein [Planctomycetaceae bacterium]|nr:PepSY-associated TM helix domain-containing protein [Planctomycetaceae bacterium]